MSVLRAASILCSAAVLTVACPQSQSNKEPLIDQHEPTPSCVVECGTEAIVGSWGRASTRTDSRDEFARILHINGVKSR